jgi:putative membrane protein insertion efficiency factor
MNTVINLLFRFYKFWVSPLLGANCRYHPSCSAYAREALEKHGLLKGSYLAARRLLRCHPWTQRPFKDPVP